MSALVEKRFSLLLAVLHWNSQWSIYTDRVSNLRVPGDPRKDRLTTTTTDARRLAQKVSLWGRALSQSTFSHRNVVRLRHPKQFCQDYNPKVGGRLWCSHTVGLSQPQKLKI